MAKGGRTTRKRKAQTTADIAERYERELWEWVAGREYEHDAQRAYRIAHVAIRALLQRAPADVEIVARLHDVLTAHARGLDGRRSAAHADLDLAVALQAVSNAAGLEGLETARRMAIMGLGRIPDVHYAPTVEELQALVARTEHTLPGLVALLILKARGIGEDARNYRVRLQKETDRVGRSLSRGRRTRKT